MFSACIKNKEQIAESHLKNHLSQLSVQLDTIKINRLIKNYRDLLQKNNRTINNEEHLVIEVDKRYMQHFVHIYTCIEPVYDNNKNVFHSELIHTTCEIRFPISPLVEKEVEQSDSISQSIQIYDPLILTYLFKKDSFVLDTSFEFVELRPTVPFTR